MCGDGDVSNNSSTGVTLVCLLVFISSFFPFVFEFVLLCFFFIGQVNGEKLKVGASWHSDTFKLALSNWETWLVFTSGSVTWTLLSKSEVEVCVRSIPCSSFTCLRRSLQAVKRQLAGYQASRATGWSGEMWLHRARRAFCGTSDSVDSYYGEADVLRLF